MGDKMNLVEVAAWIQQGQRVAYDKNLKGEEFQKYVLGHVLRKAKGQLNPSMVLELIKLETSVPNKDGMIQC